MRKLLLISMISIIGNAYSQTQAECDDYIEVTKDKMTGNVAITAPIDPIISSDDGKNGLSMYWLAERRILILKLMVLEGGCIDQGGDINVLFRDGTRLTTKHNEKFNCKGDATVWFFMAYKKKELEMMTTKEIEAIRVVTHDSYVQRELTEEQSSLLLNSAKCMLAKIK